MSHHLRTSLSEFFKKLRVFLRLKPRDSADKSRKFHWQYPCIMIIAIALVVVMAFKVRPELFASTGAENGDSSAESVESLETGQSSDFEMSEPDYASAQYWFYNYDSIAEIVDAYSEKYEQCMSFYRGNGFAYMEVRDGYHLSLQVIFEDWRTGKLLLINHESKDTFSGFEFELVRGGDKARQKTLGVRGNLEGFSKAAEGAVKPAKLDYMQYLKDGKIDSMKVCQYIYDKEKIINNLSYYCVTEFVKHIDDVKTMYMVNDRPYLEKFLDFYLSKNFQIIYENDTTEWSQAYKFMIELNPLEDEYGIRYDFSIYKAENRYVILSYNYNRVVYITEEEFSWLKNWFDPIANLTYDFEPLFS